MSEKSLIERKEKKNIFQWLKEKFQKVRAKSKKTDYEKQDSQNLGEELSEEELDEVKAGFSLIDFENNLPKQNEKKTWELTKEQLDAVHAGYPKAQPENSQPRQEEEQELSEEELDEVKAGFPLIDGYENEL